MEILKKFFGACSRFVKHHILVPKDLSNEECRAEAKRRLPVGILGCICVAVCFFISNDMSTAEYRRSILGELLFVGIFLAIYGFFTWWSCKSVADYREFTAEMDAMRAAESTKIQQRKYRNTHCSKCGSQLTVMRKQFLEKRTGTLSGHKDYQGNTSFSEFASYRIFCICPKCGEPASFKESFLVVSGKRNEYGATVSRNEYGVDSAIAAYFKEGTQPPAQ